MTVRKMIGIILAIVLSMAADSAYGSIRCPSGGGSCLANAGDDKSALYACCGSPDMQSSNVRVVRNANGAESVNVEVYTYNCGDGRFIKKVTMENDRITDIQDAGRGSGSQKCD